MSSRLELRFDGLEEMLTELNRMGAERARRAAEEALKASHAIVTPKSAAAIARHRRSGRTAASLLDEGRVDWLSPTEASIDVGFSISSGGLASIFLTWGTPRMAPDRRFHAAVWGSKPSIEAAQLKAFEEALA